MITAYILLVDGVNLDCSTNQYMFNDSSPGGWNDPDLLLGSTVPAAVFLTQNQSRTQFSLWAITAAPLVLSANVLNMTVSAGVGAVMYV